MKLKSYLFLIALLACMAVVNLLYAGTTGKISGVVSDAVTGEPLIGANVIIQGTTIGMATDIDGNYVMLNLAPGDYTLVVSMIGYQQVQLNGVHVSIDLTTTLDVKMQPTAVELEAKVITAEKPLVIKDNTGSLSSVGAEQIRSLPVQTISEILRLDAGIVEYQGGIHIRGGRSGEVSYWVDGISTTDVYDGTNGVRVENSAVQELQVISGTFNAEYGQAMSGIVNTVTKEGGEKYSGQIRVYAGDYVSNDDRFSMYKTLTTAADPATGLTRIVNSQRVTPLKDFNPIYNGEFSLSGPFPILGSDLRFFAMGRYLYDEGYYYGVNWYTPIGGRGDNSVVPMNPNKVTTLQGKVSYQLTSTIKASYGAYWNKSDNERFYFANETNTNNQSYYNTHNYKYDPYGLPRNLNEGLTQIFTLNHVLSPTTFYELRVGNYYSKTEQYKYKDPAQKVNYLVQKNADSSRFNPFTPEGQDTLNAMIARGDAYTYVADPNGPEGYLDPSTLTQPAPNSFMDKGMFSTHLNRSTAYWVGKFDLTTQLDRTNEVKIGAEARLHELTLHSFQVVAKKDANGNSITPFEPDVPEIGSLSRDDYNREPIELSAYAQDKLEFSDIILNIGLRFDYFDANSYVPVDPTDPNIYDPFKNSHIYQGWVDMPADYQGSTDQYISEQLAAGNFRVYTPEERKAFMQKKIDPKLALSPRLGFSFPITDRGIIHFSYGHFFQIPQFQFLYADPDFKVSSSSGNTLMGNADLEPQKTVMYEIGLQQQLSDIISVDVTLFYRDVRGWVGTSPLIYTERDNGRKTNVAYSIYENKDYENVRGVTLKIEKRLADNYSFRADYTFQSAEGTYSNPTDAYNDATSGRSPVLALLPLNWDQNHTVNVQGIYSVSDWTFSLIGRYWTGLPYTPSFTPEAVGASAMTGFTNNSARLPDQKAVDITINKTIRLANNFNVQFFVSVYNLFDQRDATTVYTDTGSAEYTAAIDPTKISYHPARVSTIEDFVNQPSWYTAPRQVQVGMAIDF